MDMEQEIQAAGADKAPRITPADIEANIVSEHYFTAADGVIGVNFENTPPDADYVDTRVSLPLCLLTFCVLVLKNDFTVTGESACASPENFNAEIGRKVAREKAIDKVWPLMGYALKEKLAGEKPVKAGAKYSVADIVSHGLSNYDESFICTFRDGKEATVAVHPAMDIRAAMQKAVDKANEGRA